MPLDIASCALGSKRASAGEPLMDTKEGLSLGYVNGEVVSTGGLEGRTRER